MTNLDDLREKLKAIADIVNSFKSEAVQLRVTEVLLAQLGDSDSAAPPAVPRTRTRVKRRRASKKAEGGVAKSGSSKRQSRTAASPGAFAMISQLLDEGYFKSPKTIGAIVAHCGSSKGHHYKANECSPALLRLLRDAKLKRQKNKDGQYEYSQA